MEEVVRYYNRKRDYRGDPARKVKDMSIGVVVMVLVVEKRNRRYRTRDMTSFS